MEDKVKKIISLILVLAMSLFAFVGCAKEEQKTETQNPVVDGSEYEGSNTEESSSDNWVKTGLAVVTSVEKSKDATSDAEGYGQFDSVVVAVTVDKDGKVVKAVIDNAQTKVNFSTEGKLTSDLTASYKSKQELKDEYGMKGASTLNKEWYEHANSLAEYFVGKTADEIKAIPTDDAGVSTDADLVSSVTIKINEYKEAAVNAIADAQDMGATADDKLGLGINTTISKSKDASADTEGQAQSYSIYTATTFDADGKITSNIIDASQATVEFDDTGKISTDLTIPIKTKVELGDEYGMKGASKIDKEWFEQAASFSEYILGKTSEEVAAIAVEDGKATDADLVSSVTIGIDEFKLVIDKAAASVR